MKYSAQYQANGSIGYTIHGDNLNALIKEIRTIAEERRTGFGLCSWQVYAYKHCVAAGGARVEHRYASTKEGFRLVLKRYRISRYDDLRKYDK